MARAVCPASGALAVTTVPSSLVKPTHRLPNPTTGILGRSLPWESGVPKGNGRLRLSASHPRMWGNMRSSTAVHGRPLGKAQTANEEAQGYGEAPSQCSSQQGELTNGQHLCTSCFVKLTFTTGASTKVEFTFFPHGGISSLGPEGPRLGLGVPFGNCSHNPELPSTSKDMHYWKSRIVGKGLSWSLECQGPVSTSSTLWSIPLWTKIFGLMVMVSLPLPAVVCRQNLMYKEH
ncbi:hypothetical protein LY78DRAFT_242303 [Colletotrichum sublineola]|nr:hypothetical protein LY78DRAFT_242303 [Colletotrichum sublineola]